MTLEELAGMLEKTGFPFAYDHFAEGKARIRRLSVICFPAVIILRQTGGYTFGSVK